MSFEVFCPFFWLACLIFLVLSCMSCLYILGSKRLSVTSFAHIFFHSVCCHLILFMASFALQKLLCLIGSHLFLFLLPWETDLRRSIFLSFFIQGAWITGVVAEREWVILKNRNSWMKNDLRGSLPSGENFLACTSIKYYYFFRSLLNLLQNCFCFVFWLFGQEARGILGWNLHPLHWKAKS